MNYKPIRCHDRMCGALDCLTCYPEGMYYPECEKCGEPFEPLGRETLCDICEGHIQCDECNEWIKDREAHTISDGEIKLCPACLGEGISNEEFKRCDVCLKLFYTDELVKDKQYLCNGCWEEKYVQKIDNC